MEDHAMVMNPPEGYGRITPYLLYEDVGASLSFLSTTFGLVEQVRMTSPDGSVNHAEMSLEGGIVMMGCPGPEYRGPKKLGHATQLVYAYVDDLDAHSAQAREAGGTTLAHPA